MAPVTVWFAPVGENYHSMFELLARTWADVLGATFAGALTQQAAKNTAGSHLVVMGRSRTYWDRPALPYGKVVVWFGEPPAVAKKHYEWLAPRVHRVLHPYPVNPIPYNTVSFFPAWTHPLLQVKDPPPVDFGLYLVGFPTDRRNRMLGPLRGRPWFKWEEEVRDYPTYLGRLVGAKRGLIIGAWDDPCFYPIRVITECLANGVLPVAETRTLEGGPTEIVRYCRAWVDPAKISDIVETERAVVHPEAMHYVREHFDLRKLVGRYPLFD